MCDLVVLRTKGKEKKEKGVEREGEGGEEEEGKRNL